MRKIQFIGYGVELPKNTVNFKEQIRYRISGDEKQISLAVAACQKTLKNTKQLKKEGFEKEDFDPFVTKASAFKRSMDEFVKKMDKKEKASHSSVSDSFFAQTEEGTPENVLANFNEVIKEHNTLLAKKTKK